MAEVTRVYRRQGLIGDDAEQSILLSFEQDAAAFFAGPVKLTRSRRVNGGQYVEYTYERDDMAIFGSTPKPEGDALKSDRTGSRALGRAVKDTLEKIRLANEELINDLNGVGENKSAATVGTIVRDIKDEQAELNSVVAQLTNGGPE